MRVALLTPLALLTGLGAEARLFMPRRPMQPAAPATAARSQVPMMPLFDFGTANFATPPGKQRSFFVGVEKQKGSRQPNKFSTQGKDVVNVNPFALLLVGAPIAILIAFVGVLLFASPVKGGAKLSLPVPIAVEKKAAEPKKEAPAAEPKKEAAPAPAADDKALAKKEAEEKAAAEKAAAEKAAAEKAAAEKAAAKAEEEKAAAAASKVTAEKEAA